MVGTGAVIFHDLKNHRMNDIEFSLEEMLNFEGETGVCSIYVCTDLLTSTKRSV